MTTGYFITERDRIIDLLEDRLQTNVSITRAWRGWKVEADCTGQEGFGMTEVSAANDLLARMGLEKL